MRFAKRPLEDPAINLTSLIDIVFLLLIFFMLSTRFIADPQLSLQLPAADNAATALRDVPIEIMIASNDRYELGGETLAPTQLAAVLGRKHEANPRRPLLLRADARASHGAVVRVLDLAAAQGFARVDIAVRQPEN